jgi:hypothetical protein
MLKTFPVKQIHSTMQFSSYGHSSSASDLKDYIQKMILLYLSLISTSHKGVHVSQAF